MLTPEKTLKFDIEQLLLETGYSFKKMKRIAKAVLKDLEIMETTAIKKFKDYCKKIKGC